MRTSRGFPLGLRRAAAAASLIAGLGVVIPVTTVSATPSLGLVGHVTVYPGYANRLDVVGPRAYVADWSGVLNVIDVADPAHPTVVGRLPASGDLGNELGDVTAWGNRVYLANDANGTRIVDVTDPAAPTVLASRSDGTYAFDVEYDVSRYLYAGYIYTSGNQVSVYDVAADTMNRVGTYTTVATRHAMQLDLVGDRLYLYSQNGTVSFEVVDVSTPTAPRRLGSVPWVHTLYAAPAGIRVVGNYAYVSTQPFRNTNPPTPGGMAVLDVSDPANPRFVAFLPLADAGWADEWHGPRLDVAGERAYVGTRTGLTVIDVSNPLAPSVVTTYPYPPVFAGSYGGSVVVRGDYAYVTSYRGTGSAGGLAIYRVTLPPPTVDAGGPYTGNEGSAIAIAGTAANTTSTTWSATATSGVDPGASCTFADPSALTTTVTCTDDGTWTLTLTGEDGTATATDETIVTVANVAPTATVTSPAAGTVVFQGTPVTVSGMIADPGANDTHTVSVAWGDGTTTLVSVGASGYSAARSYDRAGLFTVTVTVTDDDGGVATPAPTVGLVVVDPAAGRVTGGGWFTSPKGAVTAQPAVSGKATFEVASQYVGRSTVPTGTVRLSLPAAGLSFVSTAQDWLVVTGNSATFAGTGTVNGAPGFRFQVWVTDNAKADQLRIRIWNGAGTVYDSGTLAAGNGQVTVHR